MKIQGLIFIQESSIHGKSSMVGSDHSGTSKACVHICIYTHIIYIHIIYTFMHVLHIHVIYIYYYISYLIKIMINGVKEIPDS
jgi:hypothetical protein